MERPSANLPASRYPQSANAHSRISVEFTDGQKIDAEGPPEHCLCAVRELRKLNTSDASTLEAICSKLESIEGKVNLIMATQAEFKTKIDEINASTSASAAAAQAIATKLDELRAAVVNSALTGAEEQDILAQIDALVAPTAALKTFLEATAAGPVTDPEPDPVPVPE